jgi:predicted O-methyltransferase YrrM
VRVVPHFVLWLVGLTSAQTQTTEAERRCLARHAAGKRRLVEIGVWHGVTTARIRSTMAPDAVLYAVDPFPRGRLGISLQRVIARRHVAAARNGAVEWVRLTGREAARRHAVERRELVDFVFIDGDHQYEAALGDWENWNPLVAPGGIIALHDSRVTADRPIHAAGSVRVTEERALRDSRFSVVEVVDTLTVLRRVAGS